MYDQNRLLMNFLTAARRESLKVVHSSSVVATPSMRLRSELSSVAAVLRLSQSALLYKGIWHWVCFFLRALVLILCLLVDVVLGHSSKGLEYKGEDSDETKCEVR